MRIGVFHGSAYYLRYYDTALQPLVERGHELVLARPETKSKIRIPKPLATSDRVTTAFYPIKREDGLDRTAKLLRLTRDVARYTSPELRDAYANRRRALRHLARFVSQGARELERDVDLPFTRLEAGEAATLSGAFAALERLIPPNERLVRFIAEQQLDAVLCITRVNFGGKDAEIVKAARAAGVPSGMLVYSWDNLSSKALIHEHPDRLFVWNDVQVQEAVELHGIERAAVEVTGAARFDAFFELKPSAPRDEQLARLGLDPARATILYLGSSGFVTKNEPEFVDRWVAALREGGDERLRGANVIVRPHPGAFDEPAWVGWSPAGERVVLPEINKRDRELFDQIWVSDAVVALNTSAEIEAAIVGRPVLTVHVGDLAPGQEGSSHFRYLLAGEGGFVETAATLDEHFEQLARALADDPHADARHRFLESFVRPLGLDRPAGPALADALERLALVTAAG